MLQIYEWIRRGGVTAFAVCAAVQDIRHRGITVFTFAIFSMFGAGVFAIGWLSGTPENKLAFTAFIPGICLWLISRITGGMIGEGDAVYLLTAAWYLSIRELVFSLLAGSICCALTGLLILTRGMFRGQTEKKHSLPFTAFLLLPLMGVIWC